MTIDLTTPLGEEVLDLKAGDRVTLTGMVYTARDEAHLRMQKDGFPFDPEGAAIGLARSDIGDPDDTTTVGGPGRVVWTELLADDEATAASFYEAVVGYNAGAVERRGGQYTLLRAGGVDRAGILSNPTDWEPQWLTYFGVEDPAAAAERAATLGGQVLLEPTPEVREGTMALVTDPTGAVLALQKSTR